MVGIQKLSGMGALEKEQGFSELWSINVYLGLFQCDKNDKEKKINSYDFPSKNSEN